MNRDLYENPLKSRYATQEMLYIFSDRFKFTSWRRLWISLAKAEKEMGLDIHEDQIAELEKAQYSIDFDLVESFENELQHDVMAHLHAFAKQCPNAKKILHLGATSAFVVDNTDMIQIKEAMLLIKQKLKTFLLLLKDFALKYKSLECLAYTHFQPATPTTVGKRAAMWLQDFVIDYEELKYRLDHLYFLGIKGATGTQSSFVNLFEGDFQKVEALETLIAKDFSFTKVLAISGQTYTRKLDNLILNFLGSLAASASKLAVDIRLLAHLKEIEEPFGQKQVGSSAMPHKQNPIYSERICSLARFAISLTENGYHTFATQWLERSLDDSANKRLSIPQAFLAVDSILELLIKIFENIRVHPVVIAENLEKEKIYLLSEEILMLGCKFGLDRNHLHERLREHCSVALHSLKSGEKKEHLLDLLKGDPMFDPLKTSLPSIFNKKLYGRAEEQVTQYINSIQGILC